MKDLGLREKAIEYRRKGYSYGIIREKIGIPKSTLSGWLGSVEYSPNEEVIRRIGKARAKSGELKHKQKIANIEKARTLAKKQVGALSKRDIFMLGIGLYWGEGDKFSNESVKVMNSDPIIINAVMSWLGSACGLKKENFTLTLHAYPDNNIRKCIEYWSQQTGIPKSQFYKTQIDKRKNKKTKKRKLLPYGTIKLVVKSNGNKDFGVFLHRKIIGWIDAVKEQTNKRV